MPPLLVYVPWRTSSSQLLSDCSAALTTPNKRISHCAEISAAGGRHDFDRAHRAGTPWPAAWLENLSDEQRAVLEPPYHPRHERPTLQSSSGELTAAAKQLLQEKGWDGIGDNALSSEVNPSPLALSVAKL